MTERENSLPAPTPSESPKRDQPEQDTEMESLKTPKSSASAQTGQFKASNRQGPYEGYVVTRAGKVIVDTARVFGEKGAREEALRVARRAQRLGRLASQEG
jgi:hypothetical protein